MPRSNNKSSRRQEILQALAAMLENGSNKRITTAALAAELEVSEAALYRHFPSKARMYEGLIDFAEDALFTRIRTILDDDPEPRSRCYRILTLHFCGTQPRHYPGTGGGSPDRRDGTALSAGGTAVRSTRNPAASGASRRGVTV